MGKMYLHIVQNVLLYCSFSISVGLKIFKIKVGGKSVPPSGNLLEEINGSIYSLLSCSQVLWWTITLLQLETRIVVQSLNCIWLFGTPWTVAFQAPLCMGISRQEYWSGLPFPPPGDHPNSGIKPGFPVLQVGSLPSEPWGNILSTYLKVAKRVKWSYHTQDTHTLTHKWWLCDGSVN